MRLFLLCCFIFLLYTSESNASKPSWVKSVEDQEAISKKRIEGLDKLEQKSRDSLSKPIWAPSTKEQDSLSNQRLEAIKTFEKNKVESIPPQKGTEYQSSNLTIPSSTKVPNLSSPPQIKIQTKRDWLNHIILNENNVLIKRAISIIGRNILSKEEGEPIFVFNPEGKKELYALGYSDKMDKKLEKVEIGKEVTAYVEINEQALEESEVVSIDQLPKSYYPHETLPNVFISKVVEIKGINVFSKEEKENIFMVKPEGQGEPIPLGYSQKIDDEVSNIEPGKEIIAYVCINTGAPEESEIISVNKAPAGYVSLSKFGGIATHVNYNDILSSILTHLTPLKPFLSSPIENKPNEIKPSQNIQEKRIVDELTKELRRVESNIISSIQSSTKCSNLNNLKAP